MNMVCRSRPQAIKPEIFYGGHCDNFNIGASNYYQQALVRQLNIFNIPVDDRPELRGLHDPYDYLRPGLATFAYKDKVWREVPSRKSVAKCPFAGHDRDDD